MDYSDSVDSQYPMGVPDHVDGDSVVYDVDQLRRRNEKPDIKTPGELAEPNLVIGRPDGLPFDSDDAIYATEIESSLFQGEITR